MSNSPYNRFIQCNALFILLSLFCCSYLNTLSAQEPTFNELIEKINTELNAANNELKETKKKLSNLTTKDLVKAYETEIESLEKQIEILKSDEKLKLKDCMDEKEQYNNDRLECENEKATLKTDYENSINSKLSIIENLKNKIEKVENDFIDIKFGDNSPIYTIDYLMIETNITSLVRETDFYSKRNVSATILDDSPQALQIDLDIISDVLLAFKTKEIYHSKSNWTKLIEKLEMVKSNSLTEVKLKLISLLEKSNCYELRRLLDKELRWKISNNESIPPSIEVLLLSYIFTNPIDIKDIHYYSWLVEQYALFLETKDYDLLDLQND